MSVPYKPHTLTLSDAAQAVAVDKGLGTPTYTANATAITGQITQKGVEALMKEIGIELAYPHKLLCDLDNETLIHVGDRLAGAGDWAGVTFQVKGIKKHAAGLPADHLSVLMERLELA